MWSNESAWALSGAESSFCELAAGWRATKDQWPLSWSLPWAVLSAEGNGAPVRFNRPAEPTAIGFAGRLRRTTATARTLRTIPAIRARLVGAIWNPFVALDFGGLISRGG